MNFGIFFVFAIVDDCSNIGIRNIRSYKLQLLGGNVFYFLVFVYNLIYRLPIIIGIFGKLLYRIPTDICREQRGCAKTKCGDDF